LGAASVLLTLTELLGPLGDLEQARFYAEEALAAYRAAGDAYGIATSLFELSFLAMSEGDGDRAITLLQDAAELWQVSGSTFMLGLCWTHLGTLFADHRGDDAAAEPYLTEAMASWRHAGNQGILAIVLVHLGHIARRRGDVGLADVRYQEALVLGKVLGDPLSIMNATVEVLTGLGQLAASRGELSHALNYYRTGLEQLDTLTHEQWTRMGSSEMWLKRAAAECLRLTASMAGAGNAAVRAVRIQGAAAALRTAALTPMLRAEQTRSDDEARPIRANLTDAAFAEAWAAGQGLSVQQAIAEALMLTGEVLDGTD
jgi:tetratricopeptide (TPR) repeat protein